MLCMLLFNTHTHKQAVLRGSGSWFQTHYTQDRSAVGIPSALGRSERLMLAGAHLPHTCSIVSGRKFVDLQNAIICIFFGICSILSFSLNHPMSDDILWGNLVKLWVAVFVHCSLFVSCVVALFRLLPSLLLPSHRQLAVLASAGIITGGTEQWQRHRWHDWRAARRKKQRKLYGCLGLLNCLTTPHLANSLGFD